MKNWLWLALIPTFVFADSRPFNLRKDPYYLDVHPDKIIFLSDNIEIAQSGLAIPGNEFEKLLQQIEVVRNNRYILLILRPGSEQLQRQLRQYMRKYDVDVGVDVLEEGRVFSIKELMGIYDTGTSDPPKPDPLEHLRPYHVTVKEDRLILDQDNIVVTLEELQTPGNPFEALVDKCEANGGNPYIYFDPTTIPIGPDLLKVIHERAPMMVSNYNAINSCYAPPTPLEAQTEGKTPVIFECRNNHLFLISLDRMKQAVDEKTVEFREQAGGDKEQFLKSAGMTTLEIDGQRFDYSYALLGKYVLMPDPNAEGHPIGDPKIESSDLWFGSQLAKLDPENQYIRFLVRPDGFDVFRRARKVCWDTKRSSTCELLGEKEHILIESEMPPPPDFN